jgi:hypothetical protein
MATCLYYKDHATPSFPPRLEMCIPILEGFFGNPQGLVTSIPIWKELVDMHVL